MKQAIMVSSAGQGKQMSKLWYNNINKVSKWYTEKYKVGMRVITTKNLRLSDGTILKKGTKGYITSLMHPIKPITVWFGKNAYTDYCVVSVFNIRILV